MPRFDRAFSAQTGLANGIVGAGETVRVSSDVGRQEWTITRIEALYELAYLRVFAAWESLLESVFYRSLRGYTSRAGQETLIVGAHYGSLAAAEAAVLGGNQFLLWHSPSKVIRRCQQHIRSGAGCPAQQETVLSSHQARLEHFGAVRHRIVHEQTDAKNKFDAATTAIAGRTYPASRPGKFLRDWDASAPRKRWLDVLMSELVGLAGQLV